MSVVGYKNFHQLVHIKLWVNFLFFFQSNSSYCLHCFFFFLLGFFCGFSEQQSPLALAATTTLLGREADWFWDPQRFLKWLKMLSDGGLKDGWARFHSCNVSDPAAAQGSRIATSPYLLTVHCRGAFNAGSRFVLTPFSSLIKHQVLHYHFCRSDSVETKRCAIIQAQLGSVSGKFIQGRIKRIKSSMLLYCMSNNSEMRSMHVSPISHWQTVNSLKQTESAALNQHLNSLNPRTNWLHRAESIEHEGMRESCVGWRSLSFRSESVCQCVSGGAGTSASRCADVANLSVRIKHRNLPLTVGINQSQRQKQREIARLHILLLLGELVLFFS